MSYIDRNLLPDERISFRTKKHLIIFLVPVILLILSFYAYQFMHINFILQKIEWAIPVMVLLYLGSVTLEYITSEFVITNKRIIMREGFFFRHITELRIGTISQVNVNQNLLGQLLDYGDISLNAFGAFDTFVKIAHPLRFQRTANEELDKVTR